MKRCTKCQQDKDISEFYKKGTDTWCKDCVKEQTDVTGHGQQYPCAIGKKVNNQCPNKRNYNTSYCPVHDGMFSVLRIAEITEWHLAGKVWVPPPLKPRRDARHGDGFLYVCEWNELIVFGIAAARDLVVARLMEHERHMPGLEELACYPFVNGEASRKESAIKRILKASEHYPWIPRGDYKWTEVVSKATWDADLSPLLRCDS